MKKRSWDIHTIFRALVRFKEVHGHCDVPSRYPEDTTLGSMVCHLRNEGRDRVTRDQKESLDQLGFDWETRGEKFERQWDDMFGRLVAYRREHLDCCVPCPYKEDERLGNWVRRQRQKKGEGLLRKDREDKLTSIGFRWAAPNPDYRCPAAYEERWHKNYEKLVVFHQENGHCLVPTTSYGKDPPFANWICNQRQGGKNGTLPAARKQLLDDLGFVWKFDRKDSEERCARKRPRSSRGPTSSDTKAGILDSIRIPKKQKRQHQTTSLLSLY